METSNRTSLERVAVALVLLMVLLQSFYALFAFLDPLEFSVNRGTELVDARDRDWVRIYASRTLFVAVIAGYLLLVRDFVRLKWVALLAVVMPITDGSLAYHAGASTAVARHVATVVYLTCTCLVLHFVVKKQASPSTPGKRAA